MVSGWGHDAGDQSYLRACALTYLAAGAAFHLDPQVELQVVIPSQGCWAVSDHSSLAPKCKQPKKQEVGATSFYSLGLKSDTLLPEQ